MKLYLITTNIEKQIVEPKIGSFITNIVFEANYRFIEPQIGPTFHEHAKQGLYVSLEKNSNYIHPFFHTYKRELSSHLNCLALCTT
jgi:hypothetical protein